MELQRAMLSYECGKCKTMQSVAVNAVGATIKAICDHAIRPRGCVTCGTNVALVRIILTKVPAMYGSVRFGKWTCPKHPKMDFYPGLLEKALKEGGIKTNALYGEIIKKGSPLRCPVCDTFLRYSDERIYSCAYY